MISARQDAPLLSQCSEGGLSPSKLSSPAKQLKLYSNLIFEQDEICIKTKELGTNEPRMLNVI
jgi:hypothetical protein